jgi:integrase/recombinase XerD
MAMQLLQSGVDITVAGPEDTATTHMYVEADLTMKGQALMRLQPAGGSLAALSSDGLMAFLQAL